MKIKPPWAVDETTRELFNTQQNKTFQVAEFFIKDSENMPVCRVQLGLEKNAADLISAAPEMLEALETLWASLTLEECKRIETEVGPVYSQVQNAIAKARGEK
jgi:hypothetical protein